MAEEERINAIQSVGDRDFSAASEIGTKQGANFNTSTDLSANAVAKADQVSISDELNEEKAGAATASSQIIPSPNTGQQNWDDRLMQDCFAVQREKQIGAAGVNINNFITGITPGMQAGGVFNSVVGLQAGLPAGMQAGGIFYSSATQSLGYQPGGGLQSPAVIKLEMDYTQAMQSKIPLKPETCKIVQKTLADSGVERNPFQSMLSSMQPPKR